MTLVQRQQAFVLRAIHLAGGGPLDEDALVAHMILAFRGDHFTRADASGIVRICEDRGWITGTTDPLLGTQWGLTPAGRIQLANITA